MRSMILVLVLSFVFVQGSAAKMYECNTLPEPYYSKRVATLGEDKTLVYGTPADLASVDAPSITPYVSLGMLKGRAEAYAYRFGRLSSKRLSQIGVASQIDWLQLLWNVAKFHRMLDQTGLVKKYLVVLNREIGYRMGYPDNFWLPNLILLRQLSLSNLYDDTRGLLSDQMMIAYDVTGKRILPPKTQRRGMSPEYQQLLKKIIQGDISGAVEVIDKFKIKPIYRQIKCTVTD